MIQPPHLHRSTSHPAFHSILTVCLGLLMGALLSPVTANAQPASDPDYTGPPIGLVNGLESTHPRLFFDAAGLEEIRAFHDSEEGAALRNSLGNSAVSVAVYPPDISIAQSEGAGFAYGLSRLPTLAMHYAMTGEQSSLQHAIEAMQFLLDIPEWSMGGEPNSGKPAGANMMGAAIAYDTLYHDLDPEFRDEFRARLWEQARLMYYWGFLRQSPGSSVHYWQNDPQNNHRFSRLGGFVLAVLAAYRGEPEEDWLFSKMIEELNFVMRWLPPDGSNHEGVAYIHYGFRQILLPAMAADHAMGTNHMNNGYFRNVPLFLASMTSPGLSQRFRFADDGGGRPLTGHFAYPVRYHGLADVQALMDRQFSRNSGSSWINLIFNPSFPAPEGGKVENLPKSIRFPDIGMVFMREGWNVTDIGASFKSSPFGGFALNEYRDTHNYHYINVAHDDPDANTFTIMKGNQFIVANSGYSHRKHSANHNTILVNGIGQHPVGRANQGNENNTTMWTQPASGNVSMSEIAYLTNFKTVGPITLTEGEAAGSYPGTGLTRYRRSFLWNEGKYILLFDDIRAQNNVDITWMVQGGRSDVVDAEKGEFVFGFRTYSYMKLLANHDYNFGFVSSKADDRGNGLGFLQLRARFRNTQNLQVASLHRPWEREIEMEVDFTTNDLATITITGADFEDIWEWRSATGPRDPAEIKLLSSTSGLAFDSSPHPWEDKIDGLTYHSGDWIVSDWLGSFHPGMYPWVFHAKHGWLYIPETRPTSGNLFWHPELDWLWTGDDLYPWFYQHSQNRWLWYFAGDQASGTQWFITVEDGELVYVSVPEQEE